MKRQQQSTQLRAQRESLRKSADEYSRDPPRPNRDRLAAFWVQQAPASDAETTTGGAGGAHAAPGTSHLFVGRVAPSMRTLSRLDPLHYHPSVATPRPRGAEPGPASPSKKYKAARKTCATPPARLRLVGSYRSGSGPIQAPQPQAPAHQVLPPAHGTPTLPAGKAITPNFNLAIGSPQEVAITALILQVMAFLTTLMPDSPQEVCGASGLCPPPCPQFARAIVDRCLPPSQPAPRAGAALFGRAQLLPAPV